MVLVCQSCQSRYHLDPHVLGAGRLVRCVSCGHTWHQETPTSPQDPLDLPPFSQENLEPFPAFKAPPLRSRIKVNVLLFALLSGVVVIPLSFLWKQQDFGIFFKKNLLMMASFFTKKNKKPYEFFKINYLRSEVISDPDASASDHKMRLQGQVVNTSQQVEALPLLKIYFWANRTQRGREDGESFPKENLLLEKRTHELEQSYLLPGESLTFSFVVSGDFSNLASTSVGF
ncbi:MAG: MJ0042-type zinc finger domain-containing protein [Holosporales bacterium]